MTALIQLINTHFAAACKPSDSFFGFPAWYHYLPGTIDPVTNKCLPEVASLSSVWLIVAAVIEVLLRIAALAAIGFVIYGGISYTLSQGEPDATSKARNTIVNALIGLAIAILSATIVSYIAKTVGG